MRERLFRGFNSISCSIDLEGLAKHLCSSFGAIAGVQPNQKMFQNMLYHELYRFEPEQKILFEGESIKLGLVALPPLLYAHMQEGVSHNLDMPFEFRVKQILSQYGSIDKDFFDTAMNRIKPYMKRAAWNEAKEAFALGSPP